MAASESKAVHIARHVTWVGFGVNAALGVLKVAAGIIGRSGAMIADGVHSFSDFVTDVIVIVFVTISHKKADHNYQYGHGKYETFAVMLISMLLAVVSVLIFIDGFHKIWRAIHGEILPSPGWIALVMAFVGIASKEWLFHYTKKAGEKIHSAAVIANAWHHRTDSLSSLATLFGIAGAMFLGQHWRVLDPLAAIIVSVFIFVVSYKIGMPAVKELLEVSLPKSLLLKIEKVIGTTTGVKAFHHLRTRRNGPCLILDFHIKVKPDISVAQGHAIATAVEHRLRSDIGSDMIVNIHVEPYLGQKVNHLKQCRD